MPTVIEQIHGFDEYAAADIVYDGWSGTAGSTPAGFIDGTGISIQNKSIDHNVYGVSLEWIFSFRFYSTFGNSASPFFQTMEGGSPHVRLVYNGDGTITVDRNSTTLDTTAVLPGWTGGQWGHLALYVKIADAVDGGAYELRWNNVNVLSASGVDTRNANTGFITKFRLSAPATSSTAWDDFVVCHGGSDFPGMGHVYTKLPTGDGAYDDFLLSTGSSHFALVDDTTPDDDSTYVVSGNGGDRDTYTFPDLTATGAVAAVQPVAIARKTDTASRSFAPVVVSGGTTYDGTAQVLPSAYGSLWQLYEDDPDGGDWDIAAVNAAEFGVKVAV